MASDSRVSPQYVLPLLDLLLSLLTTNASHRDTTQHPLLSKILHASRREAPEEMMASRNLSFATNTAIHAPDNASLGPFPPSPPSSVSLLQFLDSDGANFTSLETRPRLNLTLLDLDLSPAFPSLAAVSGDIQVALIVAYSLAAVLSLLGNVTVILVLAFGRRSSVRCYLINLAVSDITMALFCIPFSYTSFMFHRWIFAPEFCRIVVFMQHVAVTSSVYTLVAIGVDRYKALIHPLNTRWTKSRAKSVIGGIWVFSVVVSLVPLVVSHAVRYDWDGDWYYECKENWPETPDEVYEKSYTVAVFLLTFVLPVVGLGYTYLSIVGMMCSYRIPGNADPFRDQQQFHAKVKVINMMIAVMVCFVLSWFPLQVLQFLIYFAPDLTKCRGHECFGYYMSFFACHWIAMANSFMNPFIYCFMSKNFREDLCQFMRKCGRGHMRRQSNPWSRGELGSSFRSVVNLTNKTSVQSSSKMSFRNKSDKTKELELLELRPLADGTSPVIRRSLDNSPLLRNSLTTPGPLRFPAVYKGKLAGAKTFKDPYPELGRTPLRGYSATTAFIPTCRRQPHTTACVSTLTTTAAARPTSGPHFPRGTLE